MTFFFRICHGFSTENWCTLQRHLDMYDLISFCNIPHMNSLPVVSLSSQFHSTECSVGIWTLFCWSTNFLLAINIILLNRTPEIMVKLRYMETSYQIEFEINIHDNLTNSQQQSPSWVPQLVKKFPAYYAILKLFTVFSIGQHLFLSRAR